MQLAILQNQENNSMKLPIPKQDKYGMSEFFLVRRMNGRIEVKDGRTLEEYINDPRLVKLRKKQAAKNGCEAEYVCCHVHDFHWGRIPRVA